MTRRLASHPLPRGIALPAMVFLLVIVGLMVSAGMLLLAQSQHGQVLQLQSARALAAAKSASEWGVWKVSDRQGSLGLPGDTLPPCFATSTLALPTPLSDLAVQVSCSRDPASGSVDEGGLKLASYRITASATSGASGANDSVQRTVEVRHTVCKNPGASAPDYDC